MRRLGYAVADVGPSAVASLVVGLVAVKALDATALGTYSIFYAFAFLAAVLPTQIAFLPFERAAAARDVPAHHLSTGLARVVARANAASAASSLLTAVLTLYLYHRSPTNGTLLLGGGALLLSFSSPVQDAVRRLAHIVEAGWIAVVCSFVQLGVALALAAAVFALRAPSPGSWLVLVLGVTNAASAAVGLVLLGRLGRRLAQQVPGGQGDADPAAAAGGEPAPGDPEGSVGWAGRGSGAASARVVAGLLPDVSFTVGNLLIEAVGGLALVGGAEAARQLAQPIVVLGAAILNVVARQALRSGALADPSAMRRTTRRAAGGSVLAGVFVIALCYLPPFGASVRAYVPVAFSQPWLVPLTVGGNAIAIVGAILTLQLLGAHREQSLLRVEVAAGVAMVAVCGATALTGALTRPLGTAVSVVVRIIAAGALVRPGELADRPRPLTYRGGP